MIIIVVLLMFVLKKLSNGAISLDFWYNSGVIMRSEWMEDISLDTILLYIMIGIGLIFFALELMNTHVNHRQLSAELFANE